MSWSPWQCCNPTKTMIIRSLYVGGLVNNKIDFLAIVLPKNIIIKHFMSRDEQLVLTGTCLTVQFGNRQYYHILNCIHIFFHFGSKLLSKLCSFDNISNFQNFGFTIWNKAYLVIADVEITISLFNFTKFLAFKQVQTIILPFNNQIHDF